MEVLRKGVKYMRSRREARFLKSAQVHPANYVGAVLTLLCVTSASYLIASSVVRVQVPDDYFGIKREKGWIPWWSKDSISTVKAGVYEVRSNTVFFAVPSGAHAVPFKVAVAPGGIKSWIPGLAESPSLVEGSVSLAYSEESASSLISSGHDVQIEKALLEPLRVAVATHLDQKANIPTYSSKASEELQKRLPAGFDASVGKVTIDSVSPVAGELQDSIGTSVKVLEPLSHVPLSELLRYFWVSAALLMLMVGGLCFCQPLFILLSGLLIWLPVFFMNALGAGIGTPLDFDGPNLDLDLDIDFDM